MDIKTLYDSNSTMYVLGAIMRQPELIHESQYILSTEDFDGLHQVLFSAIYNLSVQGLTTLTPGDIDLYFTSIFNSISTLSKRKWLSIYASTFRKS
jgi:hypothetical protein